MSKDREDKQQCRTWIDKDVHRKAKILAAIDDKTMYEVIEDAVREYVEQRDEV